MQIIVNQINTSWTIALFRSLFHEYGKHVGRSCCGHLTSSRGYISRIERYTMLTCMLSAEMISPDKRRASSIPSRDFPEPVAPRITRIGTRDISTSLLSTIVADPLIVARYTKRMRCASLRATARSVVPPRAECGR